MNTKRINELVVAMESCSKEAYHKSELLKELLALQKEIVDLTFNVEHASAAELRIWDVEKHLAQLNSECGHAADEELGRFFNGSKILCNMIKSEISGNRGEVKAFRSLMNIRIQNRVLRNIELREDNIRTELDAIVVTPTGLTIVEVKNTEKDIFIDEKGNYYRTGEFLKWDCNIAEKIAIKESLLKKVMTDAGVTNVQIRSIVVFTNSRIEVQNKYEHIRTCFSSQLTYIINDFKGEQLYSIEEINQFQKIIKDAECRESYPLEFNVPQYKLDFATIIAKLEDTSAIKEEVIEQISKEKCSEEKPELKKLRCTDVIKTILTSKYIRYAGCTAATFSGLLIAISITNSTSHKGGL